MSASKNVCKYLRNYAETETRLLVDFPALSVDNCVVIPARDESSEFLSRFIASFASSEQQTLLILVINQPCSQQSTEVNSCLEKEARSLFKHVLWQNNKLLLSSNKSCHLLLVDCFSADKIADEQGVGLARKIGADLACKLHEFGNLKASWVYSTDADTVLPNNYFSSNTLISLGKRANELSAMVFDFKHIAGKEMSETDKCWQATQLYEQALVYYRSALEFSGSPYAFFTLGSTLSFSIEHYCQARGFPRKSGGEDFYLLNKLAKLGKVAFDKNILIQILARKSARVPFGTGPAVEKILQLDTSASTYHYYQAELFIQLKRVLENVAQFWADLDKGTDHILGELPECSKTALHSLKINTFFHHAQKQCKTEQAFRQHFHQWFDAFNTLKFLHYLQNQYFPQKPFLKEAHKLGIVLNESIF